MRMPDFWLRFWAKYAKNRTAELLDIDEIETSMVRSGTTVYVASEDDEFWEVAMKCPCGCNDIITLQTTPEAKPNWKIMTDEKGKVTLKPSVFKQTGCKAHFWLKKGRVHWC